MIWTLLLLMLACDGGDTAESTLCADLAADQPDCMNDENLLECEAAVDECGDENVAILESCPLQFSCS